MIIWQTKVVTRPRSDVTTMILSCIHHLINVVTRPRSDVTTIEEPILGRKVWSVVTRPRSDVTTIEADSWEEEEVRL